METIRKILIANRGEIAVRVMRTARKLGIATVGIYSGIDADSLHVAMADEAYCLGEAELAETYLNISKIIEIAKISGSDAVHPGYGFLAENPLFAEACEEAGIIFIGPDSHVMRMMGNKIEARAFAESIQVPITQGVTGNSEALLKKAEQLAFPVLLKAAGGGGGKGMQIVHEMKDLPEAIISTSRQAEASFGDGTVYLEKYLENPRHIEFQILADTHGHIVHLYERECSIQRRYQKIIEESPSPTLTEGLRKRMGEAAVKIGREIGYTNAGTIEFLVDENLDFYFLEMNTRIQVEHPVTEFVTGIDIVEEQIRIASGQELKWNQEDIRQTGHAIECRIYAEDPENSFMPSPGLMTFYREPGDKNIRIDTGVAGKTEILSNFDPMISKLVTWGKDREDARKQMIVALRDYLIHGIRTNIGYLKALLDHQAFISNHLSTHFCENYTSEILGDIRKEKEDIPLDSPVIGFLMYSLQNKPTEPSDHPPQASVWQQVGYWRNLMKISVQVEEKEIQVEIPCRAGDHYEFQISGQRFASDLSSVQDNKVVFIVNNEPFTVYVSEDKWFNAFVSFAGHIFPMKRHDILSESVPASGDDAIGGGGNLITSPMPGKVIRINVKEGDKVRKGELLLVIEAMKMENSLVAPAKAIVKAVNVALNDRVEATAVLIVLDTEEE